MAGEERTREVFMHQHGVDAGMSRVERLETLLAAERDAHDLLESAAHLSGDPSERALFERLAKREEETIHDLEVEEDRLEAEAFVQRALGC
jgi:bacterioferritin (cytochrome b1)